MSSRKDKEEARRIYRRAKRFVQINKEIIVGNEYYDIDKQRTVTIVSSKVETYGHKCVQVVKFSDGTMSLRDITNLLKINKFDNLKPIKKKVHLLNPAPQKETTACDMDGDDNSIPTPSKNSFVDL